MTSQQVGLLLFSSIVSLSLVGHTLGCSKAVTVDSPNDADGGGPDSGANANPDANANPSATSFCADFGTYGKRCALPAACLDAEVAVCPTTLGAFLGPAYQAAFHECLATLSCNGPGTAANPCIADKIRAAGPTAAQLQLATELCSACAQGAKTTTEQGIACVGHVVVGEGRTLSTELLELSDGAATKARSCVAPAKAAFPNDYNNCENNFLNCISDQSPAVPAACNK